MGRHQRQHSQSTKPSIHHPKNNKRLTVAVSLICSSPHYPLSSCPPILSSFQFCHPMAHIYPDVWTPMESGWKGRLLRGRVTVSGADGWRVEQNFKMTSFCEPHFQKLFLSRLCGRDRTVECCQYVPDYSVKQWQNSTQHSCWCRRDTHANGI